MKSRMKLREISTDTIFDIFNYIIMAILLVIFIWPLWFVLIASVSDPNAVWAGQVIFVPVDFTLDCYKNLLEYSEVWVGYRNTIFYTVVGTTVNVIMTVLIAYPLSRSDFYLRGFFNKAFMITMYFGGGLIPTYMVVSALGLVNTPFSLILPNAVSFFNVIITMSYFKNSIPQGLEEAASIDGANAWVYFRKIVIPLSKAIIAVILLYYAVGHWNSYFNALIYINDRDLRPLQLVLREILINNSTASMMDVTDITDQVAKIKLAESMKYGIIIISAAPLLCIYPFIQKYFVKGVMIGSIKG